MTHQFFRMVAVGALAFALVASEAQAGWGSSGGSWGSSGGSWGSSGGSSGYASSGGSSGWSSYGSSGGSSGGGFFSRMRHRHSASSGGSSGYVASSGGSSGYVASSGGSSGYVASSGGSSGGGLFARWHARRHHAHSSGGSSGGSSGVVYVSPSSGGSSGGYISPSSGGSHGSVGYSYSHTHSSAHYATRTKSNVTSSDAVLAVKVPANAKVYVNGKLTTTPGELRRYVSRNLKSDRDYQYEVRASAEVDGQTVEQVRQVTLRAGATEELAFDFNDVSDRVAKEPAASDDTASVETDSDPVVTKLTVSVPENAKVFLSGNPTAAKGTERVFQTKRLADGQSWGNYTVRVELDRDGRKVVEEKQVSLSGGDKKSLTFDFESPAQLADARK